jgi:hypothetical protein
MFATGNAESAGNTDRSSGITHQPERDPTDADQALIGGGCELEGDRGSAKEQPRKFWFTKPTIVAERVAFLPSGVDGV